MKIGLLSDIHEEVEYLAAALERFRREGTDRIIVLGDVFETGKQLDRTVALLAEAGAVGVWGNHDIGLCLNPVDWVRTRYPGPVLDYMATLRPWLECDICHFSHVEPWLDATDVMQLWYVDGPPDTPEKAARGFAAVPHRLLFVGHFHRWMAVTPAGLLAWDSCSPLRLDPAERYLVVVGPVSGGRCGIVDTTAGILLPIDLRDSDRA